MATHAKRAPSTFEPNDYGSFRFTERTLEADGTVSLGYELGGQLRFREQIQLPLAAPLQDDRIEASASLLALLHWVAGVSYFKTALPANIDCGEQPPPPATAALLEALYSEGLAELAYSAGLSGVPRPRFPRGPLPAPAARAPEPPRRLLVPVGGGKDSAVAIEVARRTDTEIALFSVGDAPAIMRTVAAAELDHLLARRTLDPLLFELNEAGAINGHVPVTAIVACIALLAAGLHGFDAVAMANERSASQGNVRWDGVEVNHQFSKSLRAERLLAAAVAESGAPVRQFSILRPASELAIARAFAAMPRYHAAFTSCNAIFRIDELRRESSWCCDCSKCRFVFLAMAPFCTPADLREIFGADLLDDASQYEGFALLAASGGHKPFECVGEEQESLVAMSLLASDPAWREHHVVRRLAAEVLPAAEAVDPAAVLALGDDHEVPPGMLDAVHAVLGP